ncbi:AAA family ATPase [Roseovarius atlanticus]|uniref:AAA family ATPase n=1 Tax=Roseovarius atlanticus TaxID=1641875 RepID=UPI001C9861CE|nr:AAA family ATPase [Roseovarius atlanticus]MBY5987185.1 ATP-binding protein [Roseovarius atlanticus]MBY6125825.1 ATP-binding protein [Roseovarius atlanticus]MBY6149714.1 ATP-binding protein [Roseovarius atlanticus]
MIIGFYVKGLFGLYSYDVSLPDISDERAERLILIYGDNGSGKTTIVNLIYHLLSRSDSRGHRTFIAKTQFTEFGIRFSDGRHLVATKRDERGVGAYTLQLRTREKILREVFVDSKFREGNYKVTNDDVDDGRLNELFDELFQTKLNCFHMSDNREFQSDYLSRAEDEVRLRRRYREKLYYDTIHINLSEERDVDEPTRQLRQSVSRAESWIKDQTLEARSANDASISDIYRDLITRLGTYGTKTHSPSLEIRESLIARSKALAKSTKTLSTVGMANDVPVEGYEDAISKAEDANLPLISQILTPYFDSVEARVEGLKGIASRLNMFVSIINNFYKNKSLHIDAVDGVTVIASDEEPIAVDVLSSGEKHLLMLMCNILVGTSQRSLFLVDEPELSLNIKWQRSLVNALLDLSSGSPVQFFMATHSIELLAEHRNSTLRLTNVAD